MKWRLFSISVFLLSLLFCGFFLNANTYATRVDVDTDNLTDYFSNLDFTTVNNNYVSLSASGYIYRFLLNTSTVSSLDCSSVYYSRVVYGSSGVNSLSPTNNGFNTSVFRYVSGEFNIGMIYSDRNNFSDTPEVVWLAVGRSGTVSFDSMKNITFDSITLGCSEEEVAPQSTPTPTPEETPTPTPIEPSATVDPNDYEYNQMEDTAIRYSFYAFCIICLSVFLIYEIIIKRIIQK